MKRGLAGAVLGIAGHVLAFGAAFLAARLVKPSGGGFQDVAAALGTFVGIELFVAALCVIAGVLLLIRGPRDTGTGLLLGWFLGGVASWIFVAIESAS